MSETAVVAKQFWSGVLVGTPLGFAYFWDPQSAIGLVSELAWPLVVIVSLYLLRSNIDNLLARLAVVSGQGIRAEFETALNEIPDPPEVVEEPVPSGDWESVTNENADRIRRLADASPSAAVLEAWFIVEKELEDLSLRRGREDLHVKRSNVAPLLSWATSQGIIGADLSDSVRRLRHLRNLAAHRPSRPSDEITKDQAIEASEKCFVVAKALSDL